MAEVNNPCADLNEDCPDGFIRDPETGECIPEVEPDPRPEDCPRGQRRNPDTNECEPIPPGPGEPDAVDPEPIEDPPPYPAPFIVVDNENLRNISNSGQMGKTLESSGIPPKFLTGTRQVTVVTSGCFLTDEIDWGEIMFRGTAPLIKFNTAGDAESGVSRTKRRAPNHGQHWINQMRNETQQYAADPLRWSMFNFWAFDAKLGREGFVNRVTGGALNAMSEPDQDMGIQGNASNIKVILDSYSDASAPVFRYGDVFRFNPIRDAEPGDYNGYNLRIDATDGTIAKYGTPVVSEGFRFSLYNTVTNEFVDQTEESMRAFLKTFATPAIRDWAGNPTNRKIQFYKHILFRGKKSGNWWNNFFSEAPDSTKEYYEKGIFPHESFEWGPGHPKYGLLRYRDYTFDAPGAFTKEELNGMILAPLHSAEITKKIGNVDTVNQKGYTSELQVPNVYFYYNALELEKDFKNKTKPEDSRSPVNLASDYILKRYKMAPREKEEENTFVETGKILKFTSDRVEKLEKINDFMKAYAENYVEINIGTVQGGPVQAIINENNMDRLLLEAIYPNFARRGGLDVFGMLSTLRINPETNSLVYRDTKDVNHITSMVLDDSFKGIKYSDANRRDTAGANVTLNDKASDGVPIQIADWFFTDLLKRVGKGEGAGGTYQKSDPMEWPLLYYG